jgi:hypothetical protein
MSGCLESPAGTRVVPAILPWARVVRAGLRQSAGVRGTPVHAPRRRRRSRDAPDGSPVGHGYAARSNAAESLFRVGSPQPLSGRHSDRVEDLRGRSAPPRYRESQRRRRPELSLGRPAANFGLSRRQAVFAIGHMDEGPSLNLSVAMTLIVSGVMRASRPDRGLRQLNLVLLNTGIATRSIEEII